MDFLAWVRGPMFDAAVAIFVVGIIWRLVELLMLGREASLSETRASGVSAGFRTIVNRSWPDPGTFKRSGTTLMGGYIFHIGFFIALLLFVPHIELFHATLGLRWPGLPTPVVDAVAVVSIVTMIAVLIHRIAHPVMRFLSTSQDYFVWAVTFLPLLTGYLAFHRIINPYPLALSIHILSIELLLVVFPFTKLMHAITLFCARWYNGAIAGRRGVQS
jgi:nitrate reductase gamma subunit